MIEQGLKSDHTNDVDLVVHPIGVGMFSEEQLDEWIAKAAIIAADYSTMVVDKLITLL